MIDVALTPADLPSDLSNSQIVILDILRATSTIVTALANGAREVRLFDTHAAALAARNAFRSNPAAGPSLLAGEIACLKAPGFDLGNSPREFQTHTVGNATLFLATTNGTRAAAAAANSPSSSSSSTGNRKPDTGHSPRPRLLIGSLLNATATATALTADLSRNTILLCAGTNGRPACEDIIGAGAILFSILGQTYRPDLPFTDLAWTAYHAFSAVRPRLNAALRLGQGGINIIEADGGGGLEEDIDFCAAIDSRPLLVEVDPTTLTARKIS